MLNKFLTSFNIFTDSIKKINKFIYLKKFSEINATQQLALSNILDVKSNKFSFLQNLNLDADPLLIAEELSHLIPFNCEFIVNKINKNKK